MDDIRHQGIYGLSGLAKMNSISFLEEISLVENPCEGWKIDCVLKVEGFLIQKHGNISIRCLVYSQRLHCWLVAESFLVCQSKKGESLAGKQHLNSTKCCQNNQA